MKSWGCSSSSMSETSNSPSGICLMSENQFPPTTARSMSESSRKLRQVSKVEPNPMICRTLLSAAPSSRARERAHSCARSRRASSAFWRFCRRRRKRSAALDTGQSSMLRIPIAVLVYYGFGIAQSVGYVPCGGVRRAGVSRVKPARCGGLCPGRGVTAVTVDCDSRSSHTARGSSTSPARRGPSTTLPRLRT